MLALRDNIREKKPMKESRSEFKDNFKVIQCHINLCRYDHQCNWKKDVRNIVDPAQKVTETDIFRLVYVPIASPMKGSVLPSVCTVDLWASGGTDKLRSVRILTQPKGGLYFYQGKWGVHLHDTEEAASLFRKSLSTQNEPEVAM